MKNLLKNAIATTLALMVIFASTPSFASPNNDKDSKAFAFSVNAITNSNKIAIGVKKDEPGKLAIKIYDGEGNHLFTDKFNNTQGMIRTYDLSESGPGNYMVRIISNKDSEVTRVTVGMDSEINNPFKAYFSSKFKDNKIKVSYYHAMQPAQVTVFDHSGKKVFSNIISEKQDFSSIINLSKLRKGDYLVRVDSNGEGIEKSVTVK